MEQQLFYCGIYLELNMLKLFYGTNLNGNQFQNVTVIISKWDEQLLYLLTYAVISVIKIGI